MKVLGIVCSPRRRGSTEIMMREALAGAASYGAETELWTIAGKEVKPCDACGSCQEKSAKCHINDDMQELYPKIRVADGLIFGAPVYHMSLAAQAKAIIDRLSCLYHHDMLAGKVAGVLSVAGSYGHEGVRTPFYDFFWECHMFAADFAWGYAREKGAVRNDKFALKASEEVGKQVACLIKQNLQLPQEYIRPIYRICRERYGIDSYPLRDSK